MDDRMTEEPNIDAYPPSLRVIYRAHAKYGCDGEDYELMEVELTKLKQDARLLSDATQKMLAGVHCYTPGWADLPFLIAARIYSEMYRGVGVYDR